MDSRPSNGHSGRSGTTRATLLLGAVMAVGLAAFSQAALAGSLPSGLTCTGNCGTDGADGVVTLSPSGASQYFFISTANGATGAGEISGVGGTDGSQLTTSVFTAATGESLSFFFDYVTSDGAGYSDYAFAQLLNAPSGTVAATLFTARTTQTGNTSPGTGLPVDGSTLIPSTSAIISGPPTWSPLGSSSDTCYNAGCGYTGWIQATYTIPTAGNYEVSFGVTNITDTSYDSGLAIDGVMAGDQSVASAVVPEPPSLFLLGSSLLGLGLLSRFSLGLLRIV